MRYLALACDYDCTLATDGVVPERVVSALRRLRESGRRLCLVTGRELDDLRRVFDKLELFDRVVTENGAQVFAPAAREERMLAAPPPPEFVQLLRERGVQPLSVGRSIVATLAPHRNAVLDAIAELGLELQVIFNKGAVMVLPTGINKASGLRAALNDLRISVHNTVAVGDAENDHALLSAAEAGVAVANALPMLKQHADWVTPSERGEGVVELVERILVSDLRELEPRLSRWDIEVGERDDGTRAAVHVYGCRILVCGTSGSGKSTLVTGMLERLGAKGYQYCLIDPEGDYETSDEAIVVGDDASAPKIEEIVDLLTRADKSVIVNLLAVPLEQRSAVFIALLARLLECRMRWGRPHWLVVDEAHHMLPEGSVTLNDALEQLPTGLMFVTVHPDRIATRILREIDSVIVVGDAPEVAVHAFARAAGVRAPRVDRAPLPAGRALYWSPTSRREAAVLRTTLPRAERHRHRRKYAAGSVGHDKSFYFRGPREALNLRAHNLALFLQIADGVDDETWLHHLRQHDYSSWLRSAIKDHDLSAQVAAIESQQQADARDTRLQIRKAIEQAYTLPA